MLVIVQRSAMEERRRGGGVVGGTLGEVSLLEWRGGGRATDETGEAQMWLLLRIS